MPRAKQLLKQIIRCRLQPQHFAAIKRAARIAGVTPSRLVRDAAWRSAQRIIAKTDKQTRRLVAKPGGAPETIAGSAAHDQPTP
jgi:uncharacterized protein (DUF1778 family)